MDVANASEEESVMIALLPNRAEWCKLDLPHMTLVYCGLKNALSSTAFSSLAKDVAMLSSLSSGVGLKVLAKEQFGERGEVDVFRLQPTVELWAMRRIVESWNKSEFLFNPHVTIGPSTGSFVEFAPDFIFFDRIMLAWGKENLTFRLKT